MKNSSIEFVVGKCNIGWVDSDFKSRFGNVDFKERPLGSFNVLPRSMNGDTMIAEGLAKECELGDVLAFLQNPPEGTKDGYANIFVLKSFVVRVLWHGADWVVRAWSRDGRGWYAGDRVFSPATVSGSLTLEPLTLYSLLENSIKKIDVVIETLDRIAAALEKPAKKKLLKSKKKKS